ncbi:hypothetical protein [Sandarakinorhabdus sp.]|uniref:hypothetical protein n=1 Tax=Sandarakinorhabdus sp. TaxID=1916663 RepID=UPI003342E0C1
MRAERTKVRGPIALIEKGTGLVVGVANLTDSLSPLSLREMSARCLIPGFDGALFTDSWKEALWARYSTGAPQRLRQSVERYSMVKRA